MKTLTAIANLSLSRPVRPVTLPGGAAVHVRDLSLSELRAVESGAEGAAEGAERNIRSALLVCAYALCEEDGTPAFGGAPTAADLATLEGLTPAQLEAITSAAVPTKAAAKNS